MSITSISYSSKKKKKKKKKGSDGFAHGLNMATVIDEEKNKNKKLHLKTILPRCGNYTEQEMKRHK